LTQLAQGLGLSGRVDLVGYQSNPEVYMQHADGFVLSSRSEGLSTVLVEAIGSGCPVISTRCGGGALEIMEHGRLGPLVDVGDVDGLARAMDAVLVNPPDKDALYKSARRFRADVIARQYLEELVN
jgi:glycosyltransferase involved in cell wall biosynthesis